MGARATALADRILEGAAGLASFAETLTDAEWGMHSSTTDSRTIGQIVNHVALVYPIEAELAKTIGTGTAVTEVTWAVVAGLNAGHAKEHAAVTKADALALLRANSQSAADAVRGMSDAQLDTAAPFGLSYNAPVTAQFVVEDHALRHSWHHLAKIRAAVGR